MKQLFLFISTAFFLTSLPAQEVTLDSCQSWARQNHPLLKQAGVINELSASREKSIASGNLPQIDLTGRATYQSDVTKIPITLPGKTIKEMSKDQYKLFVEVKQKIYDGGVSQNRKLIEESDRKISQQQNETDLYKIRETVNLLYFQSLSFQENKRILELKKQILDERIGVVSSAVKHGMVLPNDLDNLKAERLLTDQQLTETEAGQRTSADLLSLITGKKITLQSTFWLPVASSVSESNKITRPELKLFSLQQDKLEKNKRLLSSSRLPYAYAFGQTGYGRPGLNVLNNKFDDWYLIGVGLSWNLWDGNKTKHDRAALQMQGSLIDVQRDNFERAIELSSIQERNNLDKLGKLIETDQQVVALRENIAKRSASAFDNGTLTSADYLRDLNASLQAKITLEIHKIQKVQAVVNLKTIKGE